jgi:cell division protein FtsN
MGMQQQRGNTVVGFILGLVVGLAVALAVAVYVTKVPVPCLFKGQSRSAEQDAAEARTNKDWEPNAPLRTKPVTPPASAASAAAATSSSVPTPRATGAEVKPVPPAADPLGDLARARASAPGAAASAPEPFVYFVQVGAFRTPEDAEGQRAKLSLSGIETKVSEREQSGRIVYRVRSGPYERREDADRAKAKLDAAGLETALVRVQR